MAQPEEGKLKYLSCMSWLWWLHLYKVTTWLSNPCKQLVRAQSLRSIVWYLTQSNTTLRGNYQDLTVDISFDLCEPKLP
jgi:hypothetical protein